MFIAYPLNIDNLMDEVRLRIGDIDKKQFSDSVIRGALLNGIKMLQKRWKSRYMVFNKNMIVHPLPAHMIYQAEYDALVAASGAVSGYTTIIPSGYVYVTTAVGNGIVPSGLKDNDVFRNPLHTFLSAPTEDGIISQEDEYPIILAAAINLRTSYLLSNASSFQSWSDGEYSFSNISAGRMYGSMLEADVKELNEYFGSRLISARRSDFAEIR